MQRRHFLKSLPGLGLLFLDAQKALARAFPGFFPPPADRLAIYRPNSDFAEKIPIWWKYNTAFVNAQQLADALKFNTYLNDEKKKLVLYLPQNKLVLTGGNPFVLIDNKPFQMPMFTLLDRNEIYVPLCYLVPLLNRHANTHFVYDDMAQILRIGEARHSLAGVDIEAKENGVVIRIRTARTFKKGEMTVDMRYNWLHVDLYGATANIDLIAQTPVVGPVREVKAFQFEKLLSVAFRLSKPPLSRELYQDAATGEVVVILRYQEEIAGNESPKEQPPAEPQKAGVEEDPLDLSDNGDIQKQLESERQRWLIDTIDIDPGHGGKDPGAIGVGGLKEKDVVLAIAQKLGALIERRLPGVKIIYTRNADTFVELRQRTQIANENKAKLFISIHANANRSSAPQGFETYLLGPNKGEQASNVAARENSVIQFESPENQRHYEGINKILAGLAQSAFMRQSEHLAGSVQTHLARRLRSLNMKDRGVKQAGFWVMVGASMPSILVETGFITNSYDARILKTASHQQKIAEGIFTGLQQFKKDYESAI